MELSSFLAEIFGIYLVIVSLGLLFNKGLLKALLKFYKNKLVLFITGTINLVVGILIVLSHNLWTSDWRSLITLIGWIAVLKGITRIFWPEISLKMIKIFEKTRDSAKYLLMLSLVLGLYLIYVGLTS